MKQNSKMDLHGTSRDDRKKSPGVATAKKVPTAPRYLCSNGKKIFRNICKFLMAQDSLCAIDSLYVAQAASCFARYEQAEKDVEYYGITQTFQSGVTQISPWYTILINERKQADTYCRRLGLNVAAREKLVSMQAEEVKEDDFFANIIKSRAYAN